jgi:Zn-dependent protease with chaperone function
MQRRYELMDLVAVVGLCGTITTGGLVCMVANGTLATIPGGHAVSEALTGRVDGMQWLQLMAGQALVVASLILMSLFSAGLLVFPRLQEVYADERGRIAAALRVLREAV